MRRDFLLLALLGLACRSDGKRAESALGMLEASWQDSSGTVRLRVPAEARWCARDTMLELIAARNDTAFGLALYARDSLRAEGYPVFQSGVFAPWRPQAGAALRFVGGATLFGYESTWGRVVVSAADSGAISGTLDLHVKNFSGPDSLHVTGKFDRVAILPAPPTCGRANKPGAG